MGERAEGTLFRPEFNRSVRVEAAPSALTEDAGAILLRTVADRLGLPGALARVLDHRVKHLVTHPLVELLTTRILLLAQGWRDQDNADELRNDPALRLAVSTRTGTAPLQHPDTTRTPDGLPSQPTLSRMQGMLGSQFNRFQLSEALVDRACARILAAVGHRDEVTFDIDSFARPAHGKQQGVRYNGHYHMECFHPLVAYADTGDMLAVRLRPGNVHTADDVRSLLTPLLPKVRTLGKKVWLRMDCGYANGKLMAWLHQRSVKFITRLANNPGLRGEAKAWYDRTLAEWRLGPAADGRPRQATYEFWWRAKSWTNVLRVVTVLVERDYAHGELFHHEFFLATNAARTEGTSAEILARYRQRGEAEQRIGEFLTDIAAPVSSVPHPRKDTTAEARGPGVERQVVHKRPVGAAENEVSLLLGAFAYNLLHALRMELVPALGVRLSVKSLRERVLKTAATVTRHARQVIVRINPAKAALWALIGRIMLPTVPATEGAPA